MSVNLTIVLPDRPGALADLTEAIAAEGINLRGGCGFPRPGETWGVFHILVDDAERARELIEARGFEITAENEVMTVQIEDRPGALAEIARKLADEGRNIDLLYLGPDMTLVLGLEDLRKNRPGVNIMDVQSR